MPEASRPCVVIAGGGIAGLEAMLALRAHLGSRVHIELIEANDAFVERQRAVAEPFGGAKSPRVDLVAITADQCAHLRPDRLAWVDPDRRQVRTVRGDVLQYDALLIAVGATADIAIPGSLTFRGPRDVGAVVKLLEDIDSGRVGRVAFAVPSSVSWALPVYELALLTGEHVQRRGLTGVGLVVVTPERMPLDAFGPRIASHIWVLMAERGIAVRTRTVPLRAVPGGLIVAHGERVQVGRVVSLPRLRGPRVEGVPHDNEGFVETDADGAVTGVEAVWAAGDCTAFPLKQGGIAALQADAAAAALARFLGADVASKPFKPVLRGLMLDPRGQRFLDARRGDLPATPPWSLPTKVVAEHLGEYLSSDAPELPSERDEIDVGELLLSLCRASRDAR